MLKLIHNDNIIKEYEDTTVFIILNEDETDLVGKKESGVNHEQINNFHIALAFHWALANSPEIIENLLEAFDNQVIEEIEPAIETIQ